MKFTYKELSDYLDEQWNKMDEDTQHEWNLNPNPTYEMWVFSKMKPDEIVDIDFNDETYETLKNE